MKKMMKAWIQKMLGIRSPSCNAMGFDYEYDYLISKKEKKRKEKREKQVEHGRWLEGSECLTSEECDPVKAEVIADMLAEWAERGKKNAS